MWKEVSLVGRNDFLPDFFKHGAVVWPGISFGISGFSIGSLAPYFRIPLTIPAVLYGVVLPLAAHTKPPEMVMKTHQLRFALIVLFSLLLAACQQPATQSASSAQTSTDDDQRENVLEGVWRIDQAQTVDSTGQTTNDYPQTNVVIFTAGHYSFVWTFGSETRPLAAERWNPTDAEKIEAYNSIIVNTGTYELTGSTLVTRPIAAKSQEYVGGGYSDYEYRVEGDTLYLTGTSLVSFDGVGLDFYSGGGRDNYTLVRIE